MFDEVEKIYTNRYHCPYCDVETEEKSEVCVNCGRDIEATH